MKRIKKIDTSEIRVVKNMRDYSNDPYFKEKHERAKAFIEKNGLPFQNKASSPTNLLQNRLPHPICV